MPDGNGSGMFVISLDFELSWGVLERANKYEANLRGERTAVPAILRLFDEYEIHATWAIVGFLFCETRDELLQSLPARLPHYADPKLSPYAGLQRIGYDEEEDPLHYAPSLIRMIQSFSEQEIASHSFSHYYCLEAGQDLETFRADTQAALKVGKKFGLAFESFVFPRNQYTAEAVSVLGEMGIKAYRGNEEAWFYQPRSRDRESSLFRRGPRLLDSYIPVSGKNCYSPQASDNGFPVNVPSSRFLRPYSSRLRHLEGLRFRRILSGLTYAAEKGLLYHLWWHPHNFGLDLENNLAFLSQILVKFSKLRETLGMESLTMREAAFRMQSNGIV